MPIYEFYCPSCHTVFSFLARVAGSRKRPDCPRCGRPRLRKQPSSFAVSTGRSGSPGAEEPGDLDESKMGRALETMARDAEGLDENDPRAMARFVRGFYERTGMPLGPGMDEAIRRMEAGEDPDQVEEELGEILEEEDPDLANGSPAPRTGRRRLRPPARDTRLYEL
jgi:putative FmdB family regulatory protein